MLGMKYAASLKGGIIIVLLVFLIGLLLTRNSNLVMRAMVQQETRWRTANFREEQSQHFLIKYTTEDENQIPLIEGAAEKAYQEVTDVFGRQPNAPITLVVYPDETSLARSFGWDKDEQAMGVYWGGTIRILSPRAYLKGEQVEESFYREGPMVHEFTHLMVDDVSRGNYNRWWTEGVAQYVEKQVTGFELEGPASASNYYDLATLEKKFDSLDQKTAYWESLQLVEMIAQQYGEEKVYDVLTALGQGMNIKQALEVSLGISYTTFENQLYERLLG
ncbi:MAG: hypothetical protein ABFD08_05485 [Syntrophomonas sp.]